MLNKVSKKYALSGLLVLLVAGAVLFFIFRAVQSDNSALNLENANSTNQDEFGTAENLPLTDESIPQEVIENSISELTEKDQVKFQSFIDISKSGRDNDPRIDKDLRELSPEIKKQMMNYYRNLVPEKRNERGLVSFLIAREAIASEDFDFLREVMAEEPCLSMQDCKVLSPKDPHLGSVDEVSLNYPQLVVLYQLEARLQKDSQILNDPNRKAQIRSLLSQSLNSSIPKIHDKAEEIQRKYSL